jgi:tight adherence protein C
MTAGFIAVQTATFLAVSLLTFVAFRGIWSLDKRLRNRLQELPGNRAGAIALALPRQQRQSPGERVRGKIVEIAARLMPNDQRERSQLQARLIQAGIYAPWAPSVFLCVKLILIVTPPVIGFVLGQTRIVNENYALLYGAIAGGMGIVFPSIWLDGRRKARQATLTRSLPDFLDLMGTCVQSGLSLEASLQRVSDDLALAHPVLAGEMSVVQRQVELGATPDVALRSLAERSDLASLFSLSSLVEQARRYGTSVTEALRTQAEMMRYHREQQAEELGQKAAVKILFPTLLFIFPAIFVVLVGPAAVQLSEKLCTQETEVSRSR